MILESSFTTDEFGKKAINTIFQNNIKRIISARAYDPDGNKNIESTVYMWNNMPFIKVSNESGTVIPNSTFNIIAYYAS